MQHLFLAGGISFAKQGVNRPYFLFFQHVTNFFHGFHHVITVTSLHTIPLDSILLADFHGGSDLTDHKTTHISQLPRLNRIEGQVRGIKKMVEDGRYCVDILIQLRSVVGALQKVQEIIFRHHIESCVHDSLHSDDLADKEAKIEEILKLISQFRS